MRACQLLPLQKMDVHSVPPFLRNPLEFSTKQMDSKFEDWRSSYTVHSVLDRLACWNHLVAQSPALFIAIIITSILSLNGFN